MRDIDITGLAEDGKMQKLPGCVHPSWALRACFKTANTEPTGTFNFAAIFRPDSSRLAHSTNCAEMPILSTWTAKLSLTSSRRRQTGVDALYEYASFELGDCSQHVHLQTLSLIALACVDALRRGDKRSPVVLKFAD
jgi:hypothetical protein